MLESKCAIILAGGKGTRLQGVVPDRPKPMALIRNRPFLEYQLKYLESAGFKDIFLSIGHKAEQVRLHFGDSFESLNIHYSEELEPRGTGGALRWSYLQHDQLRAQKNIWVLNGDTFTEMDFVQMEMLHFSSDASVTLCLKKIDKPYRYGTVELNSSLNKIESFKEKNPKIEEGYINAGVYLASKFFLESMPDKLPLSFEQEILPSVVQNQKAFGYITNGFFIDIGVPEDYERAQLELK